MTRLTSFVASLCQITAMALVCWAGWLLAGLPCLLIVVAVCLVVFGEGLDPTLRRPPRRPPGS